MRNFKKSQIVVLLGLTALLVLTPLLSSSLRPTYLYFIFNLLIVALGAEAGFLSSAFPNSSDQDKGKLSEAAPPTSEASTAGKGGQESAGKKHKALEKAHSEKIPGNEKMESLKKCPSTSSIFFIGEGDSEVEEAAAAVAAAEEVEEEVEVAGGGNGQELFAQAETFIGNFYKQLQMQKEESWKNIHGFYQKGF